MKKIEGTYKKQKIFTLEYLESADFDENELNDVFNSVGLSLLVGMHRYIGDKRTCSKILNQCKNDDDWFNKTTWNKEQFDNFRNILINIIRNIWYYGPEKCKAKADMWLSNFSFKIKK